jgi:hypothetical protein
MLRAQQRHEAVFEPRRDGLGARAGQQRRKRRIVRALAADEVHFAALRHGIDDLLPRIEQAGLHQARCLAVRRRGDEAHALRTVANLGRRALCEQLAFAQHEHLAAALGLVEVGGAHDDRQLFFVDQLLHDLPELTPRERIDAHGGLVEQQQVGRAHQRAGEAELLLHAARELARGPGGEAAEVGHFHQPPIALAALAGGDAVQVGVEVEVLLHAQVVVQAEALGHVADAVLHRLRVGRHVDAEHAQLAFIGAHQAGHQAQQRGLAGAVGADQRGEGAGGYFERHVVERAYGCLRRLDREALVQRASADGRLSAQHSTSLRACGLAPSPSGGRLGWGRGRALDKHAACPHPSPPPEGEGAMPNVGR